MTGAAASPEPVSDAEFAAAMARVGGFERAPRILVGLSGGGDSVALTLLLRRWVAARGGDLLAVAVDHGLRPESAAEAAAVGAAMARLGVPHRVMRWEGDKPSSGLQAAARSARRRLLELACAEAGCLHLALAHNRDDQAETLLLRLSRGSGIDGLAGMAASGTAGLVRVIRPCLEFSHERLLATCRAAGVGWVEDPSNRNPRFARARLRAVGDLLAGEGLSVDRLADTARRAARARAALDHATAALLARAASLHPEGWIRLDPVALADAPEEIGLRALTRCLTVVGGDEHPPRDAAVERLYGGMCDSVTVGRASFPGCTLAGCRIAPRRGGVVIAREATAVAGPQQATPGERLWWDRRFIVIPSADRTAPVTVAALGAAGWARLVADNPDVRGHDAPALVRPTLPALWSDGVVVAVPSLGFRRAGEPPGDVVRFSPALPLAGPAFPVVSARGGII
ncbi:tRNA lysidine(34) synthetase TilS [Azospirillum griseum]|nr:tRNA lysidine(34) synthetase TilS [Azospirillum griseum]